MSRGNRVSCATIGPIQTGAAAKRLGLAAGVGSGPGNLPIIKHEFDQAIVPVTAETWQIVDVVNGKDVLLVEVGGTVVKRLVGSAGTYIRRVIVGVIERL